MTLKEYINKNGLDCFEQVLRDISVTRFRDGENPKGLTIKNNEVVIEEIPLEEGYSLLFRHDTHVVDTVLDEVDSWGGISENQLDLIKDSLLSVMGEVVYNRGTILELSEAYTYWLGDISREIDQVYLVSNYAKKTLQLYV